MRYRIPDKHYFKIHHVRPRFKNNVEAVLLFISDAICSMGTLPVEEFKERMIAEVSKFPGNQNRKLKTIQNWRTEISALFSLYYDKNSSSIPSPFASDLSQNQDLTKFFKYFLYTFQYPGGHIKAEKALDMLNENILFHPSNYFLRVIRNLMSIEKKEAYLSKGEACYMVFNDLRATRDPGYEKTHEVAQRIITNRKMKVEYDLTGDVIRYAGDILDYMVLANLLKNFRGKFYQNSSEEKAIEKFLANTDYFKFDRKSLLAIKEKEREWVEYACAPIKKKLFDTDVLAFIAKDEKQYKELVERTSHIQMIEVPSRGARAKDIGDYGEGLVYGHECMYLKINNREDLINWVKCIPNHLAVGYDIQSVELDEIKKFIEVKSTISSKKLTFNRFKLTPNEISSAQTLCDNYFVYRLQIHRNGKNSPEVKLSVIRNPIQLFKENKIDINLSTGEVNLKTYRGKDVQLLSWEEAV